MQYILFLHSFNTISIVTIVVIKSPRMDFSAWGLNHNSYSRDFGKDTIG